MLETAATATIVVLSTLCCLAAAINVGVLNPEDVPRPLMTILDRMTDRPQLRKLLADRVPKGETVEFDTGRLQAQLNDRIFGQEPIIAAVVAQVARRFAKVKRTKPIGVFMFSGPPGTGKTELGKALGEALYGDGGSYLVEMNKFTSAATAASLFGAAPGLIGSDRKAGLMRHLSDHPKTVIILDEFEKAATEVQQGFLSAWNDGYIRELTTGEQISTRDAIFVLTANAREQEISTLAASTDLPPDLLSEQCKVILSSVLPGFVLSRIDFVFAFAPLSEEALAAIALHMIVREVDEYGMTAKPIPPHILLPYVDRFHKPGFDARALARQIERDFGEAFRTLKQNGVRQIEVVWDAKKEIMTVRAARIAGTQS